MTPPETAEDMEERYGDLFKKLDKGRDGRIDISDLTSALKELGVCESYAAVRNRRERVQVLSLQVCFKFKNNYYVSDLIVLLSHIRVPLPNFSCFHAERKNGHFQRKEKSIAELTYFGGFEPKRCVR